MNNNQVKIIWGLILTIAGILGLNSHAFFSEYVEIYILQNWIVAMKISVYFFLTDKLL